MIYFSVLTILYDMGGGIDFRSFLVENLFGTEIASQKFRGSFIHKGLFRIQNRILLQVASANLFIQWNQRNHKKFPHLI